MAVLWNFDETMILNIDDYKKAWLARRGFPSKSNKSILLYTLYRYHTDAKAWKDKKLQNNMPWLIEIVILLNTTHSIKYNHFEVNLKLNMNCL